MRNRRKFTQLPEHLPYPPKLKGKMSSICSEIVTYVSDNYVSTTRYKSQVLDILNSVMYRCISGDSIPSNWRPSDPFTNVDAILVNDEQLLESSLGDLYLHPSEIEFDLAEVRMENSLKQEMSKKLSEMAKVESAEAVPEVPKEPAKIDTPTPKEHLYIRPPEIPQFDTSKPIVRKAVNGTLYTIYTSLPEIPTNQSQISATTDIEKMSDSDLLNLYPNHFVRTRASTMYEEHDGLTLDADVGILIPINGFTDEQLKDNIIKYPHIFKPMREIDGKLVSFYTQIEIDGELQDTIHIWDELSDSKRMPKNKEFIKEYVVRRYLLERDILGIEHKYPMYGEFQPYLTLFTTPEDYAKYGRSDSVQLAKECVVSRVRYKQSRNPILKAVNLNA